MRMAVRSDVSIAFLFSYSTYTYTMPAVCIPGGRLAVALERKGFINSQLTQGYHVEIKRLLNDSTVVQEATATATTP
jgi:hypothetical protein